jgi:hypothetical protein
MTDKITSLHLLIFHVIVAWIIRVLLPVSHHVPCNAVIPHLCVTKRTISQDEGIQSIDVLRFRNLTRCKMRY